MSTTCVLAKLDSSGNAVWSESFGGAGTQGVATIAVDTSDNVVVTGSFSTSIDLGDGVHTSVGNQDIYLGKFDSSGNLLWSQTFGDVKTDSAGPVATGPADEIVLAGAINGTVDFGAGAVTIPAAHNEDMFVTKFEASGSAVWTNVYGGNNSDIPTGLAVDSGGNVVVHGNYNGDGKIDFGTGFLLNSPGPISAFLVKLDSSGADLWVKKLSVSGAHQTARLAVNSSDEIAITGRFNGTMSFGDGPRVSTGDYDAYVAKFDASGGHLWSSRFGIGPSSFTVQSGVDVALTASGAVVVTGDYAAGIDVGGVVLTSAGDTDLFLAKIQ
jgi:hypothetical protein